MKNHDWRLQLPFSGPEDANSRNHSGNMSVVAAITIQLEPIQRVLFQREIVSPGPHSNCVCQPSLHKPCKVKVSCRLPLSLQGISSHFPFLLQDHLQGRTSPVSPLFSRLFTRTLFPECGLCDNNSPSRLTYWGGLWDWCTVSPIGVEYGWVTTRLR